MDPAPQVDEGTGTRAYYLVNHGQKKWGAIWGKELHRNQEIVVQWMVGVVGAWGQLIQGAILRNPWTKYKRSHNIFAVTPIFSTCFFSSHRESRFPQVDPSLLHVSFLFVPRLLVFRFNFPIWTTCFFISNGNRNSQWNTWKVIGIRTILQELPNYW